MATTSASLYWSLSPFQSIPLFHTFNACSQSIFTTLKVLDSIHYTGLSFLFALLTTSLPHGSLPRSGFLLLQISFVVQAFLAPPPTNVPNTAVIYTAGILLGNLTARYIDRLYVRVPEKEFHRLNDDGSKEDVDKLSWAGKTFWAFELFVVTRGVGWDWRVSGIPPSKPQTRLEFLRIRLLKYCAMYAGLYLVGLSSQHIRHGFRDIPSLQLREMMVAVTGNVIFLHVLIVLGYAITIYSHFALLTLPLSLLCVGMRVGPRSWQNVESWPPNFGGLKEAYSIRRFWGYTWHQQIRRIVGTPAAMILSLAPSPLLKSKSRPARLAKRYFLVMASFFFSGAIHAVGSYNVTRAIGLPPSDGGELTYFLVQGAAVIVEDLICWLLCINDQTAQPPTVLRRWLGYMATAHWYIWSRVALKVVPLAVAHGIRDDRGPLFAAVQLVERGALAVPGNFVAMALGGL